MSIGKEFLREEELRKNWFVKKRRLFSGRRIGQVVYLSGREELVSEEKSEKNCLSNGKEFIREEE